MQRRVARVRRKRKTDVSRIAEWAVEQCSDALSMFSLTLAESELRDLLSSIWSSLIEIWDASAWQIQDENIYEALRVLVSKLAADLVASTRYYEPIEVQEKRARLIADELYNAVRKYLEFYIKGKFRYPRYERLVKWIRTYLSIPPDELG